ncbi:hypothetical protein [Streptomyces sp. NPDC006855]|uniref:hypothetical protein n=1 Tax=Streptomyces sp. NPDC006855 TaxID=3364765 RepID=UPI0036AF96A5
MYEPLPHPPTVNAALCTTSPTLRPRQRRGLLAAWRTDVPTYEALPRFTNDLDRLTPAQRRRFRPGLRETRGFAESATGVTTNPAACPP